MDDYAAQTSCGKAHLVNRVWNAMARDVARKWSAKGIWTPRPWVRPLYRANKSAPFSIASAKGALARELQRPSL